MKETGRGREQYKGFVDGFKAFVFQNKANLREERENCTQLLLIP